MQPMIYAIRRAEFSLILKSCFVFKLNGKLHACLFLIYLTMAEICINLKMKYPPNPGAEDSLG